MGFYENRILPHLLDMMMDTSEMHDERTRCLQGLTGEVLEIGFGTGLNLPHYPRTVTRVVGVDPSAASARLARKRIAAAPFPGELIGLSAAVVSLRTTTTASSMGCRPRAYAATGDFMDEEPFGVYEPLTKSLCAEKPETVGPRC
jgi:SAM-dependent methyltransferase